MDFIAPKPGSRWSLEEEEILRVNSGKISNTEIGFMLGRSRQACAFKAMKMGLKGAPQGTLRGSSHQNWRGGSISWRVYNRHWREIIRPAVLERDNYLCLECGLFDPSGRNLRAHHIVPTRFTEDNSLRNHVTLCKSCHGKQDAHHWPEYTIDRLETLPFYQQQLLGV